MLEEALKHPIFKKIGQLADDLGLECYVIGGYVRDYLLHRTFKNDIDIVTLGNAIDLAESLSKTLKGAPKVSVFKNFGTAMLKYDDLEIEFVGARKESYSSDSRKPYVTNGTLEDDQNRRDFTINAMAICLNTDRFGVFVDPFGGQQHLDQKLLITPLEPELTFSDDPLRMLRAIRFAAQLNFKIDAKTLEAIHTQRERLEIVSSERIVLELNKILHTQKPSVGLGLLEKTRLLELILPELNALKGIEEIEGMTHKDNFWHTLEVVDNLAAESDDLWLRWAALLHDIGKAPTKRFDEKSGFTFHGHEFVGSKMVYKLFKRLKLPLNESMKFVQKMVLMSSRPIVISEQFVTDSAVRRLIFDAGDHLDNLMLLCEADITTKNTNKQRRYKDNFKRVRAKVQEVEERDRIRNFQPPVDGEEIMRIFNLKPGKEIGILKEAIKEAILEGIIANDYHEAKSFMLGKAEIMGLKPV
jgi:putative nucleotidyltransferase with HDIG domain